MTAGRPRTPVSGLREFYGQHHPPLLRYLGRRVSDRFMAEDLAQESWAGFIVGNGLDHPAPVALLFTISNRRLRDWLRKNDRVRDDYVAPEELTAWVGSMPPWRFRHAEVDADLIDARRVIADELARLTLRQRQAIVLRYFDDLDYRTSAEIMGITVDAFKKHLRAALNNLGRSTALIDYQDLRRGVLDEY